MAAVPVRARYCRKPVCIKHEVWGYGDVLSDRKSFTKMLEPTVGSAKEFQMFTTPQKKRLTDAAFRTLCIVSLTALLSLPAQAQPTSTSTAAPVPMGDVHKGDMHKGASGATDMKSSMMVGMEEMQKMPMTGDTDKDFAMMMKIHHQQAVHMAELQLKTGKSPEMKSMAKQIIAAQKKEIAQFDKWLARQK